MPASRRIRLAIGTVCALLLGGLAAAWSGMGDALLPWLPVKPGYARFDTDRGRVYHKPGMPLPPGLDRLDSLMAAVERDHGLRFRAPVAVFLSPTWRAFNRGRLSLDGEREVPVLGAALQTGTAIYLSPLALEPDRTPATTVAHELSHALLYQQVSLRQSFVLQDHRWLLEGLAVGSGNPNDYLNAAEFRMWARDSGYLFPPTGGPTRPMPDSVGGSFMLTEYRYFVQHLRERHGEELLHRFLRLVLRDPARLEAAFRAVNGTELATVAAEFEACVRAGDCPSSASPL